MIYKTSVQCSPVHWSYFSLYCSLLCTRWWHGNAQRGNGSKISGNRLNYSFFNAFPRFLQICKFRFRGVPSFFLIDLPKLYIHFRFPNIFGTFPYFFPRFLFFQILLKWSVSSYFWLFSSNFRSVSSYFWSVSSYFWSLSAFFKNFKNLNLLYD